MFEWSSYTANRLGAESTAYNAEAIILKPLDRQRDTESSIKICIFVIINIVKFFAPRVNA